MFNCFNLNFTGNRVRLDFSSDRSAIVDRAETVYTLGFTCNTYIPYYVRVVSKFRRGGVVGRGPKSAVR